MLIVLVVCLSPYRVPLSYAWNKIPSKDGLCNLYQIAKGNTFEAHRWLLNVNNYSTGINKMCLQLTCKNNSYCQSVASYLLKLMMHRNCTFQLLLMVLLLLRTGYCRPFISSFSVAEAGVTSHEEELIRVPRQVVSTRPWTVSEFTEVSPRFG